jgi:hypothetical protein
MKFIDSSDFKMGRVGEGRIANWLKRRGWAVLPVYEKEVDEGKGPQLFMLDKSLIAPDMLAFKKTNVRWIEAKHKTVFTWHRITQRWCTGIDLRHYRDYLQVAELSPWPVWLLFLHERSIPDARDLQYGCPQECPTGLFGGELFYLQNNENHQHKNWGRSGMVYWAHDTLACLAPVDSV